MLTYWKSNGGHEPRALRLTVITEQEAGRGGLAGLRRKRLMRLVAEARLQGARLTYSDLSMIMLSSRATLKRDVGFLRRLGHDVPIGRENPGGEG
jgi:hypothetical protein